MKASGYTPDSGAISVGDLVQVVRPSPCGCSNALGAVFQVTGFAMGDGFKCRCGHIWGLVQVFGVQGYPGMQIDPKRLKRIPPFPELKDERHDEEITA